jgi:hypothetical protein
LRYDKHFFKSRLVAKEKGIDPSKKERVVSSKQERVVFNVA